MTQLMKVLAAAVAGSALGLVVKKNNPENSLFVSIALSVFAMYLSFEVISSVLGFLRLIADAAGIPNATLGVVLKTAGISIITKLIADVCKDAGQAGAASGVEFMGAVTSIYVALPLFQTVLDMINSLLQ
ncbi:MAG: stage III sporulation AC/AD family protein [Oscillospiraceae bacterium]|jgi:stage III sporulation protein AD|nr:stage III sporulation AC/AD family protein [Oscillospiraceae bacterium]